MKYFEDPLLREYEHEKLFGMFVMMKYKVNEQQIEDVDFTENDLNAHCAMLLGIFHGLLQKYTKPTCTHPKRHFIVYLEYTRGWLLTIDRGGLFQIHDEAYNMIY